MKMTQTTIGGRAATVTEIGRVRRQKGWGYYNLLGIRFHDNNEYLSMGGAEFAKWSTKLDRDAKRAAG